MGPNFHPPLSPTTEHYTPSPLPHKTVKVSGLGQAGQRQHFVQGEDILGAWWALFHSSQLNELIEEGIANSPTLDSARAALVEARENWVAQIGTSYYPAIGLELNARRTKVSGLSSGFPISNTFNLYSMDLQGSYILDLFGGQRRLVESYRAQVDYQRYELLAAYLTLTTNIALNYIDIASLEAQIRTTLRLIQKQRRILKLVTQQFHVGGASQQDIFTQATLLGQTEATLPPLRKSLADTQHELAILIGRLPSELAPIHYPFGRLHLPKHLPVTLPSFLTCQRPDIQASEALLHVASADIGVATANLFPQITLSGHFGWIAQSLSNFFSVQNNVWDFGGQLLQPIFQGGALRAKRRAAIAAFQKAVADYHETVLKAFKDVSDTLRGIVLDAKTLKALFQAEFSARRSLKIATLQFKVGGNNYLDVLNAQENYLDTKLKRIQAQTARYTDSVLLFEALGGGWWNSPMDLASALLAGFKVPRLPEPGVVVLLPPRLTHPAVVAHAPQHRLVAVQGRKSV